MNLQKEWGMDYNGTWFHCTVSMCLEWGQTPNAFSANL